MLIGQLFWPHLNNHKKDCLPYSLMEFTTGNGKFFKAQCVFNFKVKWLNTPVHYLMDR